MRDFYFILFYFIKFIGPQYNTNKLFYGPKGKMQTRR
jgi:hypothetical protein